MDIHQNGWAASARRVDSSDNWNAGGWIPGSTAREAGGTATLAPPAPRRLSVPDSSTPTAAVRTSAVRARTRILLASDRVVTRQAFASWLGTDPGIEVVGKAGEAADVADLAQRMQPDTLVLVCDHPGHPYAEIGSRLSRHCPRTKLVIFSSTHNRRSCGLASVLKAHDHLTEADHPDDVLMALRGRTGMTAINGGALGRPRCVPLEQSDLPPALSSREREVLVHLALGMSAKQVAGELGICPKTVDNHTQRLMKKLGLHSRADVVLFAVRQGYVVP